MQNSPYASIPPKNHLLQLPLDDLRRLAKFAGPQAERSLEDHLDLLTQAAVPSDKGNLYPQDLTDAEFEALGPDRLRVQLVGGARPERQAQRDPQRASLRPDP